MDAAIGGENSECRTLSREDLTAAEGEGAASEGDSIEDRRGFLSFK